MKVWYHDYIWHTHVLKFEEKAKIATDAGQTVLLKV